MKFPNYFNDKPNFRTVDGTQGKLVEYFHDINSIKDISLNINQTFFLHVIHGTVKLQSNSGVLLVKAGDSVLVRTGMYIMSETLSGENHSFKAYLFFLSEDILEQFRLENIKRGRIYNEEILYKNVVNIESSEFIRVFVDSISLLFGEIYKQDYINGLFNIKSKELLHYLFASSQSVEIYNLLYITENEDEYVIKKAVNSNFLDNLSVVQYAFLCNMSLSSFKRKFAAIYNETPAKLIKNKRLNHAKMLMECKELKINEVAYTCGFDNPITFSKLFKEKYGILPKDFCQNTVV